MRQGTTDTVPPTPGHSGSTGVVGTARAIVSITMVGLAAVAEEPAAADTETVSASS
jgi:hypothetical protein